MQESYFLSKMREKLFFYFVLSPVISTFAPDHRRIPRWKGYGFLLWQANKFKRASSAREWGWCDFCGLI